MVLQVPKRKIPLFRLIEAHAHLLLPVRKLSFSKYISLTRAAAITGISTFTLYNNAVNSDKIHGFRCGAEIWFHPDGILPTMRKAGAAIAMKHAKELGNLADERLKNH